jgi:hypothetical protein
VTKRLTEQLLRHAALRARTRPDFLAGLLAEYQEINELDDAGLAGWLGCPEASLPRLALCLRPKDPAMRFQENLRQISEYTGVDGGRLAQLVREVEAVRAMRGEADEDITPGLLMAARDREDADGPTPPDAEQEDAPAP